MTPPHDIDLVPEPEYNPARPPGAYPPDEDPPDGDGTGRLVAVAVAVLIALLSVGVWYWWSPPPDSPRPPTASDTAPSDEVTPEDLGRLGSAPAVELPPLDDLDPVVRTMLAALSARPELARLLATDDLVRRFVVSVDNIGRGVSPARHLGVLRPAGKFSVDRPNAESGVPAETFRRYEGVAATLTSLDADQLARVYGELRPRLNDAYAELGGPAGESFDVAMERAIVHLLSVSPDQARGRVRPGRGLTYVWTDQTAELRSSAQKQLLRMGPEGAAAVQRSLRQFALALGIPASRLPEGPVAR